MTSMRARLLWTIVLFVALSLVVQSPARADSNPGNGFQRFRFPWVDDGTQKGVTQTVNQGTHTGGLAYAIDWNHAYNTFMPAVGQGTITTVNTNDAHSSGLGKFVSQAVSTSGAGTKYIMYGHLCFIGVSQNQYLYQGQYIGRSGNTGNVQPTPSV